METNSVKYFKEQSYDLPVEILPPIIIAWKLRTPENYGSLLRIANTIGCRKVVFVSGGDVFAERKIKKTAGDSYHQMAFEHVNEDEVWSVIPENYTTVALETATGSKNIYRTKLPENMALVVGNEKRGVEAIAIDRCDEVVHIPLTGRCTSLNVSHAATVALFEWLRQNLK